MDEVLLKIYPKSLPIATYPVGLESALEIIMPSLRCEKQQGVIMFGIYGMHGGGKTTLAKAIYNQLLRGKFKTNSSFLAEVRENSGSNKGLASLQKQLINDILKGKIYVKVPDVDQGIALIEARICSTKLLVVIDDLDNEKQFKSLVRSFASGSIVIITTTSQKFLDDIKVELKYRHRVNGLDDAHSRALFTKHAFKDGQVNKSFMELYSEDILRLSDGLPLALELFGTHLSSQSKEEGWKSFINNLRECPDNRIQEKLIITLKAIASEDPMLKQLFLDIACFFIGSKKEEAAEILETYYSFADHKIDILKKRCMLTLNNNGKLRMHDLLRDMGREVARNGFLHNKPQNHSRLWVSEDIRKVLTNKTGTEAIECIIQHDLIDLKLNYRSEEVIEFAKEDTSLSFTLKTFKKMTNLRFLHLQGGTVSGNFMKTFGDLRWLHWEYCPLTFIPSEFYPSAIVILELPHSKITKWEPKLVFEKLKKLDMSYSLDLVSTPNLDMFTCLETLYLRGCSSLKVLPENLGKIVSLKKLHLAGLNVSGLPDSFACLQELVELDLSHNIKLETLPETIFKLTALCSLSVFACTSLKLLPDDLGNIRSLTKLHAGALNVSKLPDSIGRLANLVELNLTHNQKLTSLPDTICSLKALEVLCINQCTLLKELPKELGNMKSLRVLYAEWLCITNLPDSIGSLHKLVELYIPYNIKLASLPDNICKLRALEILHIHHCTSLKSLPKELGKIQSLRVLGAEFLKAEKLPDSIGHLGKLVELKLSANFNLTTLPNTISNLSSLEILDLSGSDELKTLPKEIWELPSLRELDASYSPLLKELPDIKPRQIPASPLMNLNLSGSGLTDLPRGFSQLSKLENLNLFGCSDLVSIPELPPNLQFISACGSKSLEYLFLTNCSGLMEIRDFDELTSLIELHLGGCNLSLLRDTLTRRFFQLWSGFGHEIKIHTPSAYLPAWITQSPYWISVSSDDRSTMFLELLPNVSGDFLGIILCFTHIGVHQSYGTRYSINSTKSESVWRNGFTNENNEAQIMIVPASIFSVRDGERIKVTANQEIHGIHLLYKTDEM